VDISNVMRDGANGVSGSNDEQQLTTNPQSSLAYDVQTDNTPTKADNELINKK